MRLLPLACLLSASFSAQAAIVDTPQCRADFAEAMRLIHKIAARDDVRAHPYTPSEPFCRVLRLDLVDLSSVEALAGRCLTEPQRSQELSGLRQSIVITQRQIRSRCREGR